MNGPPVLFTAQSSETAHISDFYFEKNVEKYSFAAENGCAVYLFFASFLTGSWDSVSVFFSASAAFLK